MPLKDEPRLLDIREAIDDVLEFTRDGEEAFKRDKKTQFAVVRSLRKMGWAKPASELLRR